jgi:hypothetical protein
VASASLFPEVAGLAGGEVQAEEVEEEVVALQVQVEEVEEEVAALQAEEGGAASAAMVLD